MATKKRKSTKRRTAARRKKAEQRLPAGLGTLFGGLLLMVLAFVQGDSVWRVLHDVLFGLFGCGSFVLGAAVCCLAVLYTRGEELLSRILKLVLGLIFVCGTVIVFSDIQPQGLSALQMLSACYANGVNAWLSGGAIGFVLGGVLLLLCGRPAANLIMIVLLLCGSLYIFDVTPAEVWVWLCAVTGGIHARGAAFAEQRAARRAERTSIRQAEREIDEEYDETEDEPLDEEDEPAGLHLGVPDWMSGVLRWGHKVTQEMEADAAETEAAPAALAQPEPAAPPITPVRVSVAHPRAAFDVDLGPDHTALSEGGSEPIEPLIVGPGGTFGQDPLRPASKPTPPPIVANPVVTAAADFFATDAPQPEEPSPAPAFDAPIVQPTAPVVQPQMPTQPEAAPIQPAVPRVSAENAVAFRSAPDEDGWISITAEPVEEKDINSLVAAAMEKPAVSEQAAATAPAEETEPVDRYEYQYPPIELFEKTQEESDPGAQEELKANAQKLVDTLESFGVRTRVLDISRGPSVTRYELQPMAGVKISRITSLADDIALNLAVADVRMEAPIPGKPAVGIEVPNHKKTAVSIRSIFESQSFLRMTSPLGIALGKDIAGVAQVTDLCKMPHLLIAGSTGSGKSVCVNSIIMSLLFRSSPEDVKLLLIDPKVVELAEYNGIPHLLMPVVTEPKKAAGALGSAVQEMERRYHLFAENNVRDIKSFNKLAAERPDLEKMPYIAIIIDELADLMMVVGKDVEDSICRIAQLGRACGIHLIVATQRPSVDVITGLIKANIPSRIAFAVSNGTDSRVIMDASGAEKLLGKGDMLFHANGASKPTRAQGAFVSDEEVEAIRDFFLQNQVTAPSYDESVLSEITGGGGGLGQGNGKQDDDLLPDAVRLVVESGTASISMIQRRLRVGYARAARLVDIMEQNKFVSEPDGAKPRKVLIDAAEYNRIFGGNLQSGSPGSGKDTD